MSIEQTQAWELLDAEYDKLCETDRGNINMGDFVLFKDNGKTIAGKVTGICQYFNGGMEPPGYYFQVRSVSGEDYEIDDCGEIEKRDVEIKTVTIPAKQEHGGVYSANVRLYWTCPVCGCKRGEPQNGVSWDGSRRLYCDSWFNPCRHVDKYSDVRAEAKNNRLNIKEAQSA
jgi:hypothetical protein